MRLNYIIDFFHLIFIFLPFVRSLEYHKQEVGDMTENPGKSLKTYSYNKYHPMGEVSVGHGCCWWPYTAEFRRESCDVQDPEKMKPLRLRFACGLSLRNSKP